MLVGYDDRGRHNCENAVARQTAEGKIGTRDPRLRHEGEKGPLVWSLETYEWYYTNRARPWELQALTRARAITGALQNEFIEFAKRVWRQAGRHPDLLARIDDMLERIRHERGSGSDFADLKTGRGGIIEAEFLVQALQMRGGIWEPNLGPAIELPEREGQLWGFESRTPKNGYELLT